MECSTEGHVVRRAVYEQAMSLHPHSNSKLLSTFSSASSTSSSDHHKLSRGSCTGLFFQLFDWNCRLQKGKLFRHKSLPAERPTSAAPKDLAFGNEKLHTAQMLEIADGGSGPHDLGCKAEDALRRDQMPEKKRKKRSPNVVAKLMGLETMPSPDLRREKWPIQDQHSVSSRNFEGLSSLSNSRMPSSRRSLMEMENFSSRRDFSTVLPSHDPRMRCDESVLHNMPCKPTLHNDQACRDFTMVAAPPTSDEKKGTFGCILSPSGTHNKMLLPIKSPMASKATVRMFEAADRMLEPSRKPRNVPIRSQASRQLLPAGNSEKENGEKENNKKATERNLSNSSRLYTDNTATHCGPKQDRRIDNAGSFPAASRPHATNIRQRTCSSSAANENITEDAAVQQLKRGLGIVNEGQDVVNEDKDSVKRNRSQQGAEFGMDEKEKPHPRRQERNSRLVREVTSMKVQQNTSSMKAKLERNSSSLKCNSTLENCPESHGTSSTRSTLSTVTQSKSIGSSNSTSKKKRLLSSGNVKGDKESRVKSDKAKTRLDSLPAVKSLLTRRAGTMGPEGPVSRKKNTFSKHKDVDNKFSSRPVDASYISKDPILETGSIDEGSDDEVLDDRLNEASCSHIQYSDDVVDAVVLPESMHEGDTLNIGDMGEDWELASTEIISTNADSVNLSSDLSIAQNMQGRSAVSCIDEVRDTASPGDITNIHRRKPTVSYSGKSTATILQELLSALNSSPKLSIVENAQIQQNSEVSGITSTTFKTIESTLDASISLTGDDSHNSLALFTSSFSNYSQKLVEGSEWLSNTEDKENGWQLSQRPSLGAPFHNQPCISSENMECVKERQDCCRKSSECVECIENRQISTDEAMSQLTGGVIQSEEDYVKCIVNSARLSPQDIFSTTVQATDSLIDHALFNKLEDTCEHNWECSKRSNSEENRQLDLNNEDMAREYRKLVFDCVREAVSLDVGISEHSIRLLPRAQCRRVLKHIHDWGSFLCGMNVDDMVEKEMNAGAGKWVDFSSEFSEVAAEMGASIVNSLIEELVVDISSSCPKILDARTGRKTRPERFKRKELIWVGL